MPAKNSGFDLFFFRPTASRKSSSEGARVAADGLSPAGAAATCYPAFGDKLDNYSEEPVVTTGNLVTSRGPATAIQFALGLIDALMPKLDAEKAKGVGKAMLVPGAA